MLNLVVIAVLAAASSAEAGVAERAPPARAPSEMTNAEIKAYNEGLAATHPHYIKCRKIEEIGSWVKNARVCRTNEQWKQAWAQSN